MTFIGESSPKIAPILSNEMVLKSLIISTITRLAIDKNSGSIISVVGKTTVEIIELFECTQKVP